MTAVRSGDTPNSSAAARKVSGAGLPGKWRAAGDVAVDHDLEAIGETRGLEDFGCVSRRRNDADGDTALFESVEEADRPWVGLDPVAAQHLLEGGVLGVAQGVHGAVPRLVVDGSLGQDDPS